jgi:hypothetical protein
MIVLVSDKPDYRVLISQEGLLWEGLQTMLRRAWFEQGVY